MRKCFIISIILFTLALVATAEAGNGSPCKDPNAQTGSGELFASKRECKQADEVFTPSVSISPAAAQAQDVVFVSASGFHASATVTLALNFPGQAPHFFIQGVTDASGAVAIPLLFSHCGDARDLTATVVDSFGVHAQAEMTLC